VAESVSMIHHLAVQLTAATKRKRIKWKVVDDTSFQYSTRESSVVVKSRDRDGVAPYVLQLFNAEGVVVEELETAWMRPDDWGGPSEPAEWNEPLQALYHAARGDALNIDKVIGSLLDSLKEEPPF